MNEIHLARSWWLLFVIGLLILPVLFLNLAPLWDYMMATIQGLPRPIVRWIDVIGMNMILVFFGLMLYWIALSNLLIKFTEEGIRQPALFRWKFIRWTDVTSAVIRYPLIEISSHVETIHLNIIYFRDKHRLQDVLSRNFPPEVGGTHGSVK